MEDIWTLRFGRLLVSWYKYEGPTTIPFDFHCGDCYFTVWFGSYTLAFSW